MAWHAHLRGRRRCPEAVLRSRRAPAACGVDDEDELGASANDTDSDDDRASDGVEDVDNDPPSRV